MYGNIKVDQSSQVIYEFDSQVRDTTPSLKRKSLTKLNIKPFNKAIALREVRAGTGLLDLQYLETAWPQTGYLGRSVVTPEHRAE